MREQRTAERGRGLGPLNGRQLTIIIVAIAVCAAIAIPTAALASAGAFNNNSATVPALQGTNHNANGTGVKGTGRKYGVFSNGALGVAHGKKLKCTSCVTTEDLSPDVQVPARAYALVHGNGTVVQARTRNIAVSRSSAGLYCIDIQGGIPPHSVAPIASSAYDGGSLGSEHIVVVDTNAADLSSTCSAPKNDALIIVFEGQNPSDGTGTFTDGDFTVAVP